MVSATTTRSPLSPERRSQRARTGALAKNFGADDPRTREAVQECHVLAVEESIRRLVESAPPLTPAQRDRLSVLLKPAREALAEPARTTQPTLRRPTGAVSAE